MTAPLKVFPEQYECKCHDCGETFFDRYPAITCKACFRLLDGPYDKEEQDVRE